jgi:2-oxo-4-hydroxy-4-carboxy-5-ureidoimidazoline decarboxylase
MDRATDHAPDAPDHALARFNAAPQPEARSILAACCAASSWIDAVLGGRPYRHRRDLLDSADAAARRLRDADIDRALEAHPRIGQRAEGAGREAAWSRGEQSGVGRDRSTLERLAAANGAYERRFGRVFLICAAGLSVSDILAALYERLDNDDETELAIVADELRKIAVLRLRKVLE